MADKILYALHYLFRFELSVGSLETPYGMHMEAPEVFDLSQETDATHALYGLARGTAKGFAWQCLVARRLAERGYASLS